MSAPIFGRESDERTLFAFIDGVNSRGQAVIVRGEAGIGKTSLVDAATGRARSKGFQVLTAWGVQSEANLPFAALHQLLRPLLREVEQLPPPQRSALAAALGTVDAPAPDLFFTALAAP